MIHNDRGGQCRDEVADLAKVVGFEVDHDVPAEGNDPFGDGLEVFMGQLVHKPLDEVETHPAHTCGMERLELGIGDIPPHGGNAPRQPIAVLQGIDQGAIIGAVAGGLHDDVAGKAQVVAQGPEPILPRVTGRVLAFRCERETGRRPKYVAVRIHCPRWWLVCGLRWRGMKGQPVWIHDLGCGRKPQSNRIRTTKSMRLCA